MSFLCRKRSEKKLDGSDLNGFLLETGTKEPNATLSEKELLAATFIVEDNASHDILAYFSLLHDKTERQIADKTVWNKLSRVYPTPSVDLRAQLLRLVSWRSASR